jgi:hypothetical protein
MDLFFAALVAGFALLCGGLLRLCHRLMGGNP